MSDEFDATNIYPIVMKYFNSNGWKRCVKAYKKEASLKLAKAKTLFKPTTPDLAEIIQFWLDNHKEEESKETLPEEPANGDKFFVDREGDKNSKKKRKKEESSEQSENKKQKKDVEESEPVANGTKSEDKKDKKKKKKEKKEEEPTQEPAPESVEPTDNGNADEKVETPKKDKKSKKKEKKANKEKAVEEGKTETPSETQVIIDDMLIYTKEKQTETTSPVKEEPTPMEVSTPKNENTQSPPNTPPSGKKKKANEPFRRVKAEEIEVDPRLASNDFTAKVMSTDEFADVQNGDEWGKKAWQDLKVVKGKDFRHAKTKKKKGTYRGGQLDMGVNSVKFDNSDAE